MRLTCPNCSAQYEVDERVIPQSGRDVQCSACGNTWYQYPMEVALQMRAAELEDDDDETDDSPAPRRPGATPRIDQTVLDVLREEADRELTERRRSRAALETQGELGLVTRPQRSKAAPSRIYGEPDPEAPPPPEDIIDETATAEEPRKGRKLLPDIEELTSSLEPGAEARQDDDDEDDDADDDERGFRRGLSTVMMVALALILIYVLAPIIATYVPATEGVLRGYVSLIDGLRASVSAMLRQLFGG